MFSLDPIQTVLIIQIVVFCLKSHIPMMVFSFATYWCYISSRYIDPYTSTLICTGVCLLTAFLLDYFKRKDIFAQIALLISIQPLLWLLLYDHVHMTNHIKSTFTAFFICIQILQMISTSEKVSDFINRFIYDSRDANDGGSTVDNDKNRGKSC